MGKHFNGLIPDGMKYCYKCKQIKPTSSFSRDCCEKDGLQSRCKSCQSWRETSGLRKKYYALRECTKQRKARCKAKKIPMLPLCELCPDDDIQPAMERHHPDYDYPLIFISSCRPCHVAVEKDLGSNPNLHKTPPAL